MKHFVASPPHTAHTPASTKELLSGRGWASLLILALDVRTNN